MWGSTTAQQGLLTMQLCLAVVWTQRTTIEWMGTREPQRRKQRRGTSTPIRLIHCFFCCPSYPDTIFLDFCEGPSKSFLNTRTRFTVAERKNYQWYDIHLESFETLNNLLIGFLWYLILKREGLGLPSSGCKAKDAIWSQRRHSGAETNVGMVTTCPEFRKCTDLQITRSWDGTLLISSSEL